MWNILNRNFSRLWFGTYSKMSICSSPSKQQPKSLTRFLCWSFATNTTSFLNSSRPCLEHLKSLFTAISWPSESLPWRRKWIKERPLVIFYRTHENHILSSLLLLLLLLWLIITNDMKLVLYRLFKRRSMLPAKNKKKKNKYALLVADIRTLLGNKLIWVIWTSVW